MAEKVGISPWEIRFKNAVRPGDELYNGQIADSSTAIAETLLSVKDAYMNAPIAGIACAMKNCGSGCGIPDIGRCTLRVHHGHVWVYSAAGMIGQGVETVLMQIVSSFSKIDGSLLRWADLNTDLSRIRARLPLRDLTTLAGEAPAWQL